MMTPTYTPDQVFAVFVALNCAGYLYNLWVDSQARNVLPSKRRTSIEVVIGVAMTLLGVSFIIGPQTTLVLFGAFAMTGVWMIYGDFKRGEQAIG